MARARASHAAGCVAPPRPSRSRVDRFLAAAGDAPRLLLYLALYHEAVCANLLEALLLHDTGSLVGGASEEALSEAADYALRSAVFLASPAAKPSGEAAPESPAALLAVSETAQQRAADADCRLSAALSGVACLRALAQRMGEPRDPLPPAVCARLVRAADAPAALAGALKAAPWRHGRRAFLGGAWSLTDPESLHPTEAHAWLALLALMSATAGAEGEAAGYDPVRRSRALAAVRKLVTPRVLAALPAAGWLQRAAEAEAGVEHAAASARDDRLAPSCLLIAVLPPWRDMLLANTDWANVTATAAAGPFGATAEAASAAAEEAVACSDAWDETLLPPASAPAQTPAAHDAPPPPLRVAFSRRDGSGWAPAFDLLLHADTAKGPEPVAGPAGSALRGRRWRLLPPATPRRVPPGALVTAFHGGAAADVLLATLPAPLASSAGVALRDWEAAPPVAWVTLGSLAREGFALQLRLGRVTKVEDAVADAESGCVMLYRVAGGALTLREACT